MSDLSEQTPSWSRLRWGASIVAVVALHFVLLGAVGNSPGRRMEHPPVTHMILPVTLTGELQALTDPTLFAVGGPNGFSSIWMNPFIPPPVNQDWKQPDQWLDIEVSRLGGSFVEFARSSATPLHGLTFKVSPQPFPADATKTTSPLRQSSSLKVTGDLANRRILNIPLLPPQPAAELLATSEVRVMADSRGNVTSAILLPPGSGSQEADQLALSQALKLRFAPNQETGHLNRWTSGTVVFEWLSVLPTASNESNP